MRSSGLAIYSTDPLDPDADGDGFDDGTEVAAGSDPNLPGSIPEVVAVPAIGGLGTRNGGFLFLGIGDLGSSKAGGRLGDTRGLR